MDNTSPDSPMQLSKKLTRDSAVSVTGQNGWGFGLIDKIYFVSFINLNLIEDAVDMHKRNTEFSNQYFTFVRFTGLLMSSDRGTENTDLQWKYFLPLTYKSSGSMYVLTLFRLTDRPTLSVVLQTSRFRRTNSSRSCEL